MDPIVIPNLTSLALAPTGGLSSQALASAPGIKATLFALTAGKEMAKHQTPHPATVFVTSGDLSFQVQDQWHRLSAGAFVFLPGGCAHALRAESDCRFVLVVATPVVK